ncbi:cell division protein ZapC domain-containing protein [Pseudoalteromonas denitrificans]|uniref:Cell division protein ZapC n=1 Tax=Pseudoalteromonas denitrificans DSM 6059 TaxID=1123010 RepID=A0A1I1GF70_9GAMM|nr:cell division protein ZapC domain-containing protein [Pseudoalteromonas denitrificans]SFC08003.1 cell division protein ZapC [Pseudoalteromonas denitrificans DSM 6059]
MLQASKQWSWFACSKTKCLLLDMGNEMVFCTPYKIRNLTNDVLLNPAFSLTDANFYQQVYTYLSGFNLWNDAQICQVALNATAVKHYLKPVLTKSWFFEFYNGQQPSVDAIVQLKSKNQVGQFLIVDHSEHGSVCICLEAEFKLDENFSLKQFEVIKVLNDRIHPLIINNIQKKLA